jgi:hypothetical protein
MPFDPFDDFHTAGYLRNIEAERDLEVVKAQEKVFSRLISTRRWHSSARLAAP